MKIVILMGSPRKKDGYKICEKIKESLMKQTEEQLTFEYIMLKQLQIEECKGCEQCLIKGEQYCPIKDELQDVVNKLIEADGIILVSPVYACQISGTLKKVIDRLSYLFHRPQLVAKPIITVLTTAGGGIKATKDYLKLIADGWACHLSGELQVVSTRYFKGRWENVRSDKKYIAKIDRRIEAITRKFIVDIQKYIQGEMPKPSHYEVFMFHALKSKTYTSKADYIYWKEKGWLEQKYYYETKLPIGSTLIEKIINQIVKIMMKNIEV